MPISDLRPLIWIFGIMFLIISVGVTLFVINWVRSYTQHTIYANHELIPELKITVLNGAADTIFVYYITPDDLTDPQ